MKIESIDADFIRKCIPNVMFEVEGEQPFADKLIHSIESAKDWIESEYLGPDDFLDESDNSIALSIIVLKAFADAVPALDLVVTPTGFGVVNTETIAPASKDRIERLFDSLHDRIDASLEILTTHLRSYPEWRSSERGSYFCSTFLSSIRDVKLTGADSFDNMRSFAIQSEAFIARNFLGNRFMKLLREEYNSREQTTFLELHETVRSVVLECVRSRIRNEFLLMNHVWHLCEPVFILIRNDQKYLELWDKEMGILFDHLKFKNDIKGSYFF